MVEKLQSAAHSGDGLLRGLLPRCDLPSASLSSANGNTNKHAACQQPWLKLGRYAFRTHAMQVSIYEAIAVGVPPSHAKPITTHPNGTALRMNLLGSQRVSGTSMDWCTLTE